MFNNLINYHDLIKLIDLIQSRRINKLAKRLFQTNNEAIKEAWKFVDSPESHWWDIPAVKARWNYLISGDPKLDYNSYIIQKYLADKVSIKALSLACGTGSRELRWAKFNNIDCIDAYDISEERIAFAKRKASESKFGKKVNFQVNDVNKIELKQNYYDIVLAEQSLHHLSPLREIMERINCFLKPNGYFIVNEFVGPSRFQWTERQIAVVNAILSILPVQYKIRWNSKKVKSKVFKPSLLSMLLSDPTEAIQSSEIIPILDDIFELVEIKGYGGTILALLLDDIAQNFISMPDADQILSFCFEIEDLLIKHKEIQNDYVIAICRKH